MQFLVTFIILAALMAPGAAQGLRPPLKVGDRAPEFALPNGDGKLVTLAQYTSGGAVVIVFYRGFW